MSVLLPVHSLCCRLEELNVSWCDFSSEHVQAVVNHIPSTVTQLNISGYRQNLTMDGEKKEQKRKHLIIFIYNFSIISNGAFPQQLLHISAFVSTGQM